MAPPQSPAEVARRRRLQPPSWTEVERLIQEQKLEEASNEVARLLRRARQTGNASDWTKALVRETNLRMGLHGYEKAVRFLKNQAWPEDPPSRALLNLVYAQALTTYAQDYATEISQREKVETKGAVDLKAWTAEEIQSEVVRAFAAAWKDREALSQIEVKTLEDYIVPNKFPKGIRSTFRDAVTYLFVEHLANTRAWTPEQENEVHRLDLPGLLEKGPARGVSFLIDRATHPLAKIVALLDELESWHQDRPAACLEARLERTRRLSQAFVDEDDRLVIRAHLERMLPAFRSDPWWAMGMDGLAALYETDGELVRAREIAARGAAAYPASPGGEICAMRKKMIESPSFGIAAMSTDGLGKRAVEVSHRNLARLYLRAYPIDIEARLRAEKTPDVLPTQYEASVLMKAKPEVEWSVELPATPDFLSHRTFLTPKIGRKGAYVIVASSGPSFDPRNDGIGSVTIVLSDLVVLTRFELGRNEVTALDGATGEPVPGVEVTYWRTDEKGLRKPVSRGSTGSDGTLTTSRIPSPIERRFVWLSGAGEYVLARRGEDVALAPSYGYDFRPQPGPPTNSLVYTDRGVYRPLQKVLFKVVGYRGKGPAREAKFETLPATDVTVDLLDGNAQKVDSLRLVTNSFGSAAGEFTIPGGRILGSWQVRSSLGGGASILVEEYKRPTFEVALLDSKEPLRLNRMASVRGEARYVFGLPVASGRVRWSVTRQAQYPWWWDEPRSAQQVVAAGSTSLKKDGSFGFLFEPRAKELTAGNKEVTYRYDVAVDVSDEGGETRKANRTFRLGYVAVEGLITPAAPFLSETEVSEIRVSRTDLDGAPRAGSGTWRVVKIAQERQPASTLLPSEQPMPGRSKRTASGSPTGLPRLRSRPNRFRTPGDALRPRWGQVPLEEILREWSEGAVVASGTLQHDPKGEAVFRLGRLPAGAYRIWYETTDDFGSPYAVSREILVAGGKTPIAVPLVLLAESNVVKVGGSIRILVLSGLPNQPMVLEVSRDGRRISRRRLNSRDAPCLIEIPVTETDRGGLGITLTALRDHQLMVATASILVPWDDRELKIGFATFRDRMRPGTQEKWVVTLEGPRGARVDAATAELLAYMYDQTLDSFVRHSFPNPASLLPSRGYPLYYGANLGRNPDSNSPWIGRPAPGGRHFGGDYLKFIQGYGIGGPGVRRFGSGLGVTSVSCFADSRAAPVAGTVVSEPPVPPLQKVGELRSNFAETAFFLPQLRTDASGTTQIEFTVPDSVTSWKVWVHALTKDLRSGSAGKDAKSVKELMVRPYVPRFLREGDVAELKVVLNNASPRALKGRLTVEVFDPETNARLEEDFGIAAGDLERTFEVKAGGGTNVSVRMTAPRRVGLVAFRIRARSGAFSDGELRPMPILPSRMHLMQSRFVTLRDKDRRVLTFEDLAGNADPTRIDEQMVVTVDAQLFYTVLQSLPYLVNSPYECTEQTLNRFVATGMVSTLYRDHPALARMAATMSKRKTRLETWDSADPNRRLVLEETPWVRTAGGGGDAGYGLTNLLDPRVAQAEREASLAKLRKAQMESGAFPWWPGGPESPYMTLYILQGLARATEFGVEVPKDMVQAGWRYVAGYVRAELHQMMRCIPCCWEYIAYLNYTLSCYPDASWTEGGLTLEERKGLLAYCFGHWRQHSPYSKGHLALTLKRMGREQDARLVWASVMDSAKTNDELGTFWAQEDRSWLWYNDTVESHAFALRTVMELTPEETRRHGLVQWLLLNKKLNQWKSTRTTAEVIYSLVHYLKKEGALAVREDATVTVGNQKVRFVFEPDVYTGKKNQIVVPGAKIDPKASSSVVVEKESKGLAFASATWHFSTEKLPASERGDFFNVSRTYFRRENDGKRWVLKLLDEGAKVAPGDQIEVRLSLRAKHAAEYVHLRDPRAAGLEPESTVSKHKSNLGITWFEEIRDSGTNFFFEALPVGEYTFKYRLRANMAGTFRVGPATVQSMYAPEFAAYSTGNVLRISGK